MHGCKDEKSSKKTKSNISVSFLFLLFLLVAFITNLFLTLRDSIEA